MIPKKFNCYAPASLDEAVKLLSEDGEAKVLAGGQSLLPMMKLRLASPSSLVDITTLPGLSYVRDARDYLAIGALTTHDAIEQNFAKLDPILKISAEAGVPPSKLALSWLLRNPAVMSPVVGAADPAQVEQTCEALDWAGLQPVLDRLDRVQIASA